VELDRRNRRRFALERHDVHDARALEHRQRVGRIEARETVAGKQRPVDLFLAIFPAAPAGNGGKKRFEVFTFQLIAYHLFVPRSRPEVVHLRVRRVARHYGGAPGPVCCCFKPCSKAFFTSWFFHSMMAWLRSFSRYFWNSAFRLSVNTRSPMCSRACSNDIVCVGASVSSFRSW